MTVTYVGIIWDVGPGNSHLVLCPDGIVRVPADTCNRVRLAARYARTGTPIRLREDDACATTEERRLARLLADSSGAQALVAAVERSALFPVAAIERITVRWRVLFTAIDIALDGGTVHTFRWTPSTNNTDRVRTALKSAYGSTCAW